MNFRPTFIKTLLAIIVGVMSALYFRDNCFDCPVSFGTSLLTVGFIPTFLWMYGLVSLFQIYETRSKFWHYLIAVPLVIILPLLIGIFLEGVFGI
jgi:ABC-type spermidine/putrescine transport system permease subunit II